MLDKFAVQILVQRKKLRINKPSDLSLGNIADLCNCLIYPNPLIRAKCHIEAVVYAYHRTFTSGPTDPVISDDYGYELLVGGEPC